MDINCNSSPVHSISKPAEEGPQEKILASGIQLRASARVSKKLRLDQEAISAAAVAAVADKKDETKVIEAVSGEEKRKVRKAPVLWTQEEKTIFFEALNEHGKNFDEIQKFMNNRAKRRGDQNVKNRKQATLFYYRMWHKICKHVKIPEKVPKATQELYALINFGELRKKLGHITEKNAQKLNELIYSGSTQVRIKGKTWRIKTPVCRTLKKLNQFDDTTEEIKLPPRLEIRLRPRNNIAASKVMALQHNPRIRTTLPLDANLATLIGFLQNRWTPPADRASSSDSCDTLRIAPVAGARITHPGYKCGHLVTSGSVSLLAHEKRIGGEHEAVQALLQQLQMGRMKSALVKQQREETQGEDLLNVRIIDPALSRLLGSTDVKPQETLGVEKPPIDRPKTKAKSKKTKSSLNPTAKAEFEAKIREGWTKDTAGRLRAGELYIMLGSNGVVEMDYWWEDRPVINLKPLTGTDHRPVLPSMSLLDFTKALSSLLSIAKLYTSKAKVDCPCGHVCKGGPKISKNNPSTKPKENGNAKVLDGSSMATLLLPNTSQISDVKSRVMELRPGMNIAPKFKQPLLPAPRNIQTDALKTLSQIRYCNRRGRHKKSVVVQRMFPLLPKTDQSQSTQPLMLTLQVIQQKAGMSTSPLANSSGHDVVKADGPGLVLEAGEDPATPSTSGTAEPRLMQVVDAGGKGEVEGEASLSLLSLALPGVGVASELADPPSFAGLLGSDGPGGGPGPGEPPAATPPTSPSRILKEGESQWLSSEVADFSLSSFLGHLESPLKTGISSNVLPSVSDDSRFSSDVESHFQSLMTESSLDYTAKFADLAAKISSATPKLS